MVGFGYPWSWGCNNCYNDNCASGCSANYDRDSYSASCNNVSCNQREIFYQRDNCYNSNNAACCADHDSACCNNFDNSCTNACCKNFGNWGPSGCGCWGPSGRGFGGWEPSGRGFGGWGPSGRGFGDWGFSGLPGAYGPRKWYGKYYDKPYRGYGTPVTKLQRGLGYNRKK